MSDGVVLIGDIGIESDKFALGGAIDTDRVRHPISSSIACKSVRRGLHMHGLVLTTSLAFTFKGIRIPSERRERIVWSI